MHSTKYITLLALLGAVSVSGKQKVRSAMSKIKNLNQIQQTLYCDEIPDEVVDNYVQVPETYFEQSAQPQPPTIQDVLQDFVSNIPASAISDEAVVVQDFVAQLPYCDEIPDEVVQYFSPVPEVPQVVYDESIGGFAVVVDPTNLDQGVVTYVVSPAPSTEEEEEESVDFYRYVEQTGQYVVINEPSPYVQQYYTWNEPSQQYYEVPTQIVYQYFDVEPSQQAQQQFTQPGQELPVYSGHEQQWSTEQQQTYTPEQQSQSWSQIPQPLVDIYEDIPYCDEVDEEEVLTFTQIPDLPTLASEPSFVPLVYSFLKHSEPTVEQQVSEQPSQSYSQYEVFVPEPSQQQVYYTYVPSTQQYYPAQEITPQIQTYYVYSEPTQRFIEVPVQYLQSTIQATPAPISQPDVEVCSVTPNAPQLYTYVEEINQYVATEPSQDVATYYTFSEVTQHFVEVPSTFVEEFFGEPVYHEDLSPVYHEDLQPVTGTFPGPQITQVFAYIEDIDQYVAIATPHENIDTYFTWDEPAQTYVEVPTEEVIDYFEQQPQIVISPPPAQPYEIPSEVVDLFDSLPSCDSIPEEIVDYFVPVPDVTALVDDVPVVFTYDEQTQQYYVVQEPSSSTHEYYIWSEPTQQFVQIPDSQIDVYFPPTEQVYYDSQTQQYVVGSEPSITVDLYSYVPQTQQFVLVSEPTPYVETYYTFNEQTGQFTQYVPEVPAPIQKIFEQLPECNDVPESIIENYVQIPDVPSIIQKLDWNQIYAWYEPTKQYVSVSEPSPYFQDYYTWSESIDSYIQIPNNYLDYFFEQSVEESSAQQQQEEFTQQYQPLFEQYSEQIYQAQQQQQASSQQSQQQQYSQSGQQEVDLYTWVPSLQQYVYVSEQSPYIRNYYTWSESTQQFVEYDVSQTNQLSEQTSTLYTFDVQTYTFQEAQSQIVADSTYYILDQQTQQYVNVPQEQVEQYSQAQQQQQQQQAQQIQQSYNEYTQQLGSQSQWSQSSQTVQQEESLPISEIYTYDNQYGVFEQAQSPLSSQEQYYAYSEASQQYTQLPSSYIEYYYGDQLQSQQSQSEEDLYVYVPAYDQYVYVSEPSPSIQQYYTWDEQSQDYIAATYSVWNQQSQQYQHSQQQSQQQQQVPTQSSSGPVTYQQLVSQYDFVPTYSSNGPELYVYDEATQQFVYADSQSEQQADDTHYYWDQPTHSYHIYQEPSAPQYSEYSSPSIDELVEQCVSTN